MSFFSTSATEWKTGTLLLLLQRNVHLDVSCTPQGVVNFLPHGTRSRPTKAADCLQQVLQHEFSISQREQILSLGQRWSQR